MDAPSDDYLKDILAPGEKIVMRLRPHWIYKFQGWLWFFSLSALGWFIAVSAARYLPGAEAGYHIDIKGYSLMMNPVILAVIFSAAGFFLLVTEYVSCYSTHVVLTTKRLVHKSGLMQVSVNQTEMSEIKAVHVNQGWFGWILGYGAIRCDCRFVDDAILPVIPQPYKLVKAIHKIRADGQNQGNFDGDLDEVRRAAINVLPVYMPGPGLLRGRGPMIESHAEIMPDDHDARRALANKLLRNFTRRA